MTRFRYGQDNGLTIHKSRVRFLARQHCIVALGKLLIHLCASVTKQYNLVTAEVVSLWLEKYNRGLVESNSSLPQSL